MSGEVKIKAMEYAAAKIVEWCIEAVKEHKPESDPDRAWTAAYCEQCAKRQYGAFYNDYLVADEGRRERMDTAAKCMLYEEAAPWAYIPEPPEGMG